MSDLFAPLREPEPVSSLPPDEVRRRGERLRRRRAGLVVAGAVCAAAILVGGTSLLVGDRMTADSAPAPADSPAADEVIPAELDLAEGMPRALVDLDPGDLTLDVCGRELSFADGAIATEGIKHLGRGDFTARGLSVYPDAGTAQSVARDLVTELEGCPGFTDRRGRVWTTNVETTDHGDQSWAVARFGDAPGPRVDLPEAVHVVVLDSNLLVIHVREIHGVSSEDLARWTEAQVGWLLHRQMCLLTDDGCAWRSDPDVLRPDGWRALRLGMSRAEIESLGSADFSETAECTDVDLGSSDGVLSGADELVSLRVPHGVTTPDGAGVGDSRREVLQTYPYADGDGDGAMRVRASPTTDYVFTIEGGEVTQLTLATTGDACTG